MKTIVQEIPKEQVQIIKDALKMYQKVLKQIDPEQENEIVGFKLFDITTLLGLLKSTVKIELTEEEVENFTSRCGVDFPTYIKTS